MTKKFALLLLIFVLILAGCGTKTEDVPTLKPQITATPKPETKVVGDTCESKTWKITLTRALITNEIGDDHFMSKSSDGKIFLILFFDVWNMTDKNQYFNYAYFKGFADNDRTNMTIIQELSVEDYVMPLGTVQAGSSAQYFAVYELKDNWTKMVVSYDTGAIEPDEHARFVISPKQCDKIIIVPTPEMTETPEAVATPEITAKASEH